MPRRKKRNRNSQPGVDSAGRSKRAKTQPIVGPLQRNAGQAASKEQNSVHKELFRFEQPWAPVDAWIVGNDGQLVKTRNHDNWACTKTSDCAVGYACNAGRCVSSLDLGTLQISAGTLTKASTATGNPTSSCPGSESVQPPGADLDPLNGDSFTSTTCQPAPGDTSKAPCVTATCGDGATEADLPASSTDFCDDGPCKRDSDCPEGKVCVEGVCLDGCSGFGECGEGFTCIIPEGEETGVCTANDCTSDSDCDDGKVCFKEVFADGTVAETGVCTDDPCPSGYQYNSTTGACEEEPCDSDEDCAAGSECVSDGEGGKTCKPIPCGEEGGSACPEGSTCQVGPDGKSVCVPDECNGDGDCPAGFICSGAGDGGPGSCVPDPGGGGVEPPADSCSDYCDSAFKSTGKTPSGCGGKKCGACEDCTGVRNLFGGLSYSCQPAEDPGCDCPKGPKPGLCEQCNEETGEIEADYEDCQVCCTAESIPCTEDCASGDSDTVQVCVNLKDYEASAGGFYYSMAQQDACKIAESKRKESCDAKGEGCDCVPGEMECFQDSQCTSEGLVWAQGSDVAYRYEGRCRSGWDGGVGGTCDVEEIEVPVDPSTGQPV